MTEHPNVTLARIVCDDPIPVAGPSITAREGEYARTAAMAAWGADANVYNQRFERMVAGYVGVPYAISTPSCTSAIHLALAALGIGPGDEVIVPDVTWIASVAPVIYLGAKPVFVDIDPVTWCMDWRAVANAICDRTRAIIGVDLYGGMADLDEFAHYVPIIEDAAQAIGSMRNGRRAGSFHDASTFSFHGSKTVTTGEGGMLCTRDDAIADRVRYLANHGRPGTSFEATEVGYKYKMPATAAAIGVAQMERIDELVAKKRQIFGWYRERLDMQMNAEPEGTYNSYWMTTIVPEHGDKFELQAKLKARGIETRPFFTPLTQLKPFRDYRCVSDGENKGAAIAARGLNLPSGHNMTEALVDRVCDAVRRSL